MPTVIEEFADYLLETGFNTFSEEVIKDYGLRIRGVWNKKIVGDRFEAMRKP